MYARSDQPVAGFAPAKDAPSAAPAAAGRAVFSFGFGSGAGARPSEDGTAVGAAKEDSGSSEEDSSEDEESSEEEESSSSSDEEEESSDDEQPEEGSQAAPKQAAPSSSSDDSDSDASSSDSSSSDSDSDDEVGAGQGQQQQGGEFVPRRVYVGGMPYGYTEDQVGGRCVRVCLSGGGEACALVMGWSSLQAAWNEWNEAPPCPPHTHLHPPPPPTPHPTRTHTDLGVLGLLRRDRKPGPDDLPRHGPLPGHRLHHLQNGGPGAISRNN